MRWIPAAVIALVVLVAYGYDRRWQAETTMPAGMKVAGVTVGGLEPEEARRRVRKRLDGDFGSPVEVFVRGRRFALAAERAGVETRTGDLVAAAEREREKGWFGSRVLGRITGHRSQVDLPLETTYDARAVDRFVARIEHAVERRARDASVSLGGADGVRVHRGREGRRLTRAGPLRARIVGALLSPGVDRALRGRIAAVEPEVGTAELARKYPKLLVVDRDDFQLRVYERLRRTETYGIAVGQVGLDTPAGAYEIANKAIDPAWHVPNSDWAGDLAGQVIPGGAPSNPLKARWLGIYGGVGIHGTDAEHSIGTRASHGCIRMRVSDVVRLYDRIPVGTPVYIL